MQELIYIYTKINANYLNYTMQDKKGGYFISTLYTDTKHNSLEKLILL